jgi:lipid II:glycine glycyltransferase (peptidoglycan interpeptide bridge formation enzyme)
MMIDKTYSLGNGYTAEVDAIDKNEWTEILQTFSDATLYQTWSYAKIHWNENNLSHLILKKDNCIVAAVQIYTMKIPFLDVGIAYANRGPLWRTRNKEINPEVFQQMIRILRKEYAIKRKLLLRITPNEVKTGDNIIGAIAAEEGFQRQPSLQPYKTLHINLSQLPEELMEGLHKKWREKLRRAERNNLEIIEGTDDRLYDDFSALFHEMHARKKFVSFLDIDEFRAIQDDLSDVHKIKIMTCRSGGELVAALLWSAIGDTGISIFSATGNKGLKSHGAYLLRWRMLERLKEQGCQFMDQGGVSLHENSGGYYFKKGMGGTEVSYVGSFDVCESKIWLLTVSVGFALRDYSRKIIRNINKFVQLFFR